MSQIWKLALLMIAFFCSSLSIAADKATELTGTVLTKKDGAYQKARLVSNYYVSKNKFPAVIVYARNVLDIQNAIQYAREKHLSIRIRSGGHNHEGFSTGNGIVLIDVSKMKDLAIDQGKRVITVQPGVTGGELYKRLFAVGLTQDGGTCSDVGISGLILTGGMGPLLRKYGLACDSLLSIDVVDGNGSLLHATKDNAYKDLFWASCGGGGGNFGVVSNISLKVYPAKQVTWFNIGWEWDQPVEQVISTWQTMFATSDDHWFSHLDIWAKAFDSAKFNKKPIKALGVYYGTPEEARKALAPLLAIGKPTDQTIEEVNWHQAIKNFEDATAVYITDKPEYKSSGAYAMQPLPDEAIKKIVTTLQETTSPLMNVLLFSLDDSGKIKPEDTAYFYRNAKFFVIYSDQWLEPENAKKQITALDALRKSLTPYTQGDYLGNPDRNLKDYLAEYNGDNAKRLRCIKRKYDPQNIFKHEQSIEPAPKAWEC